MPEWDTNERTDYSAKPRVIISSPEDQTPDQANSRAVRCKPQLDICSSTGNVEKSVQV